MMMVTLLMSSYDALAENNDTTKTISEEYEKEFMILFNPLRLESTAEPLDVPPTLIGLVLDQKDTVTWINQDDSSLTINGDGWSTGEIFSGDSGSVKFNATGTYDFTSNNIHTKMNGLIAVVESNVITHDNIDQRTKITEKILQKLGHTQVDFEHVFSDIVRKQVIVGLSADKFTDETPASYYQGKFQNWIPFETRITIAMNSDSNSEYANFAGWSYDREFIKFHNGDVILFGKQYHVLPLDEDLDALGTQKITHTFHDINFQFYEKQSEDVQNPQTITRVKMTFPDGNQEDILVHPPMPYLNAGDKEKLHPYFSSTTNHDLPVRPIILSTDGKETEYPTYLLIHNKDLSLTEQRLLGIPESNLGCNPDLGRYIKTNGDLICLKESTFFSILDRGYFETKTVNGFDVNYYSEDIQIRDIQLDNDNSLLVNVEKNENQFHDMLTVSIPEELLYPGFHDKMLNEIRFGLLFDGEISQDAYAWEQTKIHSHRILGIPIDNSTETVSIIGKNASADN